MNKGKEGSSSRNNSSLRHQMIVRSFECKEEISRFQVWKIWKI